MCDRCAWQRVNKLSVNGPLERVAASIYTLKEDHIDEARLAQQVMGRTGGHLTAGRIDAS
jgi:hypothetical protein